MRRTFKRRRLERKTDYGARLNILSSGKPRLVARKTNRYIIAQIVQSEIAQDKVILSMTTKDLIQKGWPESHSGSLKSLSAAYLLGFMIGNKAKEKIPEVIFDIGMNRNVKKSRIYALLRGALDAGLKIPCNDSVLPSIESIKASKKSGHFIEKIKEKL